MNVAFSVGNFKMTSGIVRVVRNIAEELSGAEEYNIVLICTGETDHAAQHLPANVTVYNLDIEKYGRRKKYLKYASALRTLFDCYTPDVLVVSGMEHVPFYCAALWRKEKTRCIAWEHRNFMAGEPFRLEWFGKRLAIRKWDGILCISQKDFAQYREYIGDAEKLYQIYNLTDYSCPKGVYDGDSTQIMSCGSLEYVKGFDMLLQVAKRVFEREPTWSWDIYGEGTQRSYLEKKILDLGLEKHVYLKGFHDNVQSLYGKYGIFVMTSRSEGFGMVLIEAQKSGLPTVSFDILCGPSDVIVDGENGYLIPAFDQNLMVEKLLFLIRNKEVRQNFSEKSEIKHNGFKKTDIIEEWMQMLHTVSRKSGN